MLTIYKQVTIKTRRSSSSLLSSFLSLEMDVDMDVGVHRPSQRCHHHTHNHTTNPTLRSNTTNRFKVSKFLSTSVSNVSNKTYSPQNNSIGSLQIRFLSTLDSDNDDNVKDVKNLFSPQDMEFYDDLLNDPDLFHSIASSASSASSSSDEYYMDDNYNAMATDNTIHNQQIQEEQQELKRQAIRTEIDSRTGRLWKDPWQITDDDWSAGKSYDDLPDWNDTICSRVSLERVVVHPGKKMNK